MRSAGLIFTLAVASICFPQNFRGGLATTGDGSVVYFALDMRQRSTSQPLHSKIFAVDRQDIRLVMQRQVNVDSGSRESGQYSTNYYRLDSPQVSGDGAVVAFSGTRDCVRYDSCRWGDPPQYTALRPGADPYSNSGYLHLSRNGRYEARRSQEFAGPGTVYEAAFLRDAVTGSEVALPLPGVVAVASNGAVLLSPGHIFAEGVLRNVFLAGSPVGMDDSGATVVSESVRPPGSVEPSSILILDVASQRQWPVSPPDSDSRFAAISSDGQRVLYLSGPPLSKKLFVTTRDGSETRQLASLPEGISAATLSGDGRVAFALTGKSAILRINTDTGQTEQWLPPLPRIFFTTDVMAPGSTYVLTGEGLGQTTYTPAFGWLPVSLDAVQFLVDGVPVEFLSASPDRVTYRVPESVKVDPEPAAEREVDAVYRGNVFFDLPFRTRVAGVAPRMSCLGDCNRAGWNYSSAIHQDFTSLVTPEDPARIGETLHLYMAGLGPVSPQFPMNRIAPFSPLSRVTSNLRLTARPSFAPAIEAPIVFAGLAPGLIGFYQLSFVVPAGLPSAQIFLELSLDRTPYFLGGFYCTGRR